MGLFEWEAGMRQFPLLLCFFLALLFSSEVEADTVVDLPLDQTVEIVGPYPSYLDIVVQVDVSLLTAPVFIPSPGFFVYPYDQIGWTVTANVNGIFSATFCGSTNPGPCGASALTTYPIALGHGGSTSISTYVGWSFYDIDSLNPNTGVPGSFVFSPLDDVLITATLPDGFSIASVPEPSAWAMLLIGFAGIGFASYKRRPRTHFELAVDGRPNL